MKVIVGLGNPGPRYRHTRHNVGFRVLDQLAAALAVAFTQEKHRGVLAHAAHAGQTLLLVKPQTFMNNCGDCVARLTKNAALDDVLVAVDDVTLPLGRIRLRAGGSAGGHNGLKSIIERLGADGFHRLRLGVGDERDGMDLAGHVLAKFRPEERPDVEAMVARAAEAALHWVAFGAEQAMCAFN